jgi:pimeloyl-ACP methyl ester carboxylesterase
VRYAARQSRECQRSDYAPFAATRADFRDIMFASAQAAVQRAAAQRRSEDPCGDVASLAGVALTSGAGQVDAPVLLLYGGKDKLIRPSARDTQASAYPTKVTTKVFPGAGSALPLEKQAGKVRAAVLRWLD